MVDGEAGRCGDIVRNLLAFSRQSGARLAEEDLAPVVERCRMLLNHQAELLDVTLEARVAPDLPKIVCDAAQVQQVILALAMNALEATPADGRVSIEAPRDGDGVRLVVADTGWGIPQEHLDRIFEPFFTTKEAGKGVGLGLAVVYGIVNRHHGTIDVAVGAGAGHHASPSTCRPASRRTRPAAAAASDAPAARGRQGMSATTGVAPGTLRILIVDDETIVRDSLGAWFRQDGHQVDVAEGGKEALRLVGASRYDMAFLDIKMPGMDGLELQTRLAAADPELSVVLMTAYASVETAVKAMKNGAYDYIVKPFDPDDLSMLVKRAAEHRSLRAENLRLKKSLESAAAPPPLLGASPAMRHVLELVHDGGRLGLDRPDHRRVGHRQGGGGARDPRGLAAALQPDGGRQLRRPARGHPRERAVRPRGGRLHRGPRPAQGQVRVRRGRHGLPRRDRRREPEGAGRAAARARGEAGHPPRRHARRCRSTSGSSAPRTATSQAAVKDGVFREDLYWRLNVVHIHIPPLRERPEDVPVLAEHFLARFAQSMSRRPMRFSPEALDALAAYPWPGNVRELQNAIERAVVVGRGDVVRAEDLPLRVTQAPAVGAGPGLARRGRARARPGRARRERLEHHPRGARPRRGPGHALQQDPQVRAQEAGERGLRPPVAGEAARLAEAIDLLPVGDAAPGAARGARRAPEPARRAAPATCCRPRELPLRRIPDRDQLDADALLEALEARATADAGLLVGVTAEDIAIPVFTFVFGLARQGGRACVVSLARTDPSFYGLPPDPDLRDERAVAEILHELGHLATLEHCPDRGCLMSFAGNIERVDTRGSRFCPACAERLPHWLRGPSPPGERAYGTILPD